MISRHILRAAAFAFGLSASLPAFAAAWVDGSGKIVAGGTAQTLFGGTTPTVGWMVCSIYGPMWVDDLVTANPRTSIPISQGSCFTFPPTAATGFPVPSTAITIYSPNTGAGFLARKW